MKTCTLILSFFLGFTAYAGESCKDPNFRNLREYEHYDSLQYHKRFKKLFSSDSPAPVGFENYFGNPPHICFAVKATYLEHLPSQTTYVMYTTHEDSCDGGNTMGIIINMSLYKKGQLEESIVADIQDSAVVCR